MIEVRVLGPVDVRGHDGQGIEIPSESQRRLLTILALDAPTVVRSIALEEHAGLSPGALRTSVSRLRRLLGPDALTTTPPGYTLVAAVDVAEFDRLAALAPACGDAAARDALERATGLWRGSPMIEFASEPWAAPTITRLREAHATAVEDLLVLQLDGGESARALPTIQALIDEHPYRDRPRALLLRALADAGRRTDALRAFQAYRSLLLDEIGTEPSGALTALDRSVAGADAALAAPYPGHPAWTRTRTTVTRARPTPRWRSALPVPVSTFVGRSGELDSVADLVDRHRLVTLTGAGGCGKTRLALAVADAAMARHPGGTWWVGLGTASSRPQVLEAVARAVGLAAGAGADPTDQLVQDLERDEASLLVLDNAEHVLEPVAALVVEVLSRCRTLHVLVTSREPLALAGEVVWRVPTLDLTDARALFLERARAARTSLVVDDDGNRHVDAICSGLDGLPLAIELAAARTRTLPLSTVARGVDDALRWQSTGVRSALAHHATLHASISWSVDLLDPTARALLTRLAVFESSFPLSGAVTVGNEGGTDDEIADAVSSLVDASLLELDGTTGRYRMLRIVRQFATTRAAGTAELDVAHARHACYIADWCTAVGDGHHGIERGPLQTKMPDVVAAMAWARRHDPSAAFRMCAGLACVRSALGYNSNVHEMWDWLASFDRTAPGFAAWSADWGAACAALMAPSTAQAINVGEMVGHVLANLPADRLRERGWLARGAAMTPAYHGRVEPIMAHVREATARGDEMELCMYGGFAAYMLSLMGRRSDVAAQLGELRRFTRRHHTTFSVDTVGNGYAAAVLDELISGELRAAAQRVADRVPDDPAFSMTAAAALAQVALATADASAMACARRWSQQETIPLLRYLPTLIDLNGAMMDGAADHAADLAEQFWEEARPVTLGGCHAIHLVTAALIAAGRDAVAGSIVDEAAALVLTMDDAPWPAAGVLHSRAQLALTAGDGVAASAHAHELGDLAALHGFATMGIDATEFAGGGAAAERDRIGYRWRADALL